MVRRMLTPMYHVAIVVPDLDRGLARFSDLLGLTWGPEVNFDREIRLGDGTDLVTPQRLSYSTEPPYIELIEERAGTPWVCNEFSNIHHIGFFSDALAADSLELSAKSCPLVVSGRVADQAPELYALHRDPLGVHIEYVDLAGREGLERWLGRA
jgi:catechol 2,3-dioxygenase-like lactoylglutathione lyase family enzyme